VCFLRKNKQELEGKLRQYVEWCLDNCKNIKVSPRQHAPSTVEIAVIYYFIFFEVVLIENILGNEATRHHSL